MMHGVKIIGLSGTNGAGKDAVGHLLAEHHHYLFISVADLLREELQRQKKPTTRLHTRTLSAAWRREFGLSVLVDRAIQSFGAVQQQYAGVVISSLRNPFEADRVHELDGSVIWVDAEPEVRYQRLQAAKRQGREGDDDKTFEQFLAEEQIEMTASEDNTALNMLAVKDRSDAIVINNATEMSVLEAEVGRVLGLTT